MKIHHIGIIGVGGVGGYFGGKLCELQNNGGGVSVAFVARGEHLRVIPNSGLLLNSEDGGDDVCRPSLATDDIRGLPRMDLCLSCVKVFDSPDVLSRLEPIIAENIIVLPLLNGMDIYSRVGAVMQCTAYFTRIMSSVSSRIFVNAVCNFDCRSLKVPMHHL